MNFRLFKQKAASNIELQPMPFTSELKMEAFIIDNPNVLSTDEGANIEIITDQLHVPEGRKSKNTDGRIDLLADIDNSYLAIVELKKGIFDMQHVDQLKDYLDEATNNRTHFLQSLQSENDYSAHKIIGIIVGSDITDQLKLSLASGLNHKDANIYGITLNRYFTKDRGEIYTLSETFAPSKSPISRIRFSGWTEFSDQLNKRGIPPPIISLTKNIHDDMISSLKLSTDSIAYTPSALTLNTSLPKKRIVFAYIQIQKKALKLFLSYEERIPEGGTMHSDQERYPDIFFVTLRSDNDYTVAVKEMIRRSYEIINAQ